MRGTLRPQGRDASGPGIIPAYAGNTAWPQDSLGRLSGSSPRMRGTPCSSHRSSCRLGIIPAYAGNTSLSSHPPSLDGDHPRVCGEHRSESHEGQRKQGSSPRMRGTLMISSDFLTYHGIIPAYAGNTAAALMPPVTAGDHPRVCGEHNLIKSFVDGKTGSSPRMRGTRKRRPGTPRPAGIIPAYAGNTRILPICRARPWDHPRVCGEHSGTKAYTSASTGSSPRMRGTL